MSDSPTLACTACNRTVESKRARLPKGWHRSDEAAYCADCWQQRYRLRAVTFPVAEVLDGNWSEFTTALRDCWSRSTALANWAVTELAKNDTIRAPDQAQLGPMPPLALYQLWQGHHQRCQWIGAAQSANAILRAVENKYRKSRLEVIWRAAANLPRYRYPVPYPVHNAAWQATYLEYAGSDGQISKVPAVSVPLGQRRWLLRLRGGPERRRQLASFAQIVTRAAIQGELSLYRRRASSGAHRSDLTGRGTGGAARVPYRVMAKLVAWLPQPLRERTHEGVLEVHTGSNALFVAWAPGRAKPWLLHANHVRRWIALHRRRLACIRDDTKAERRRPKRQRVQTNDHLAQLTYRHRCRLETFCHQAAKMLAAFAGRCQVAEVIYDDQNTTYFSEFPYFTLRQLFEQKLEDLGIRLRHVTKGDSPASAGSEVGDENPETSREQ
jgi:hypothetical protein